jgi:hypothetical protein
MHRLVTVGRKQPLLAGGIAAAVLLVLGAMIAVSVVASGGSSSAAPEETPTPTATNTAAPPTATATRTATPETTPEPTPSAHAGILNGVYMSDEEWAARKDLLPLAVMLDNSPGAYPHSGLDRADVVYETFVEGGITRLMAVFWRQEADFLMPVRSARTPFVIWVDELGALYGHAGSSHTTDDADAGGQLRDWQIKDLDAFDSIANRAYFRSSERAAPYNLASTTLRLREAAAQKGYAGPPELESWLFHGPDDVRPQSSAAGGVEVDFSGRRTGWQLIQWKWDEGAEAYARFMFGGPQEDAATKQQLKFTTVVVMRVPGYVANTRGHYLLSQFGEGAATIFSRGQAFEVTWKKADRKSRTRYYHASGEEFTFERGPIFIEVIDGRSKYSFVGTAGELAPLPRYTPPPPQAPTAEDLPPTPTVAPTSTPPPVATPTESATAAPESEPTETAPPPASPTPIQVSGDPDD